MHTLLGVSCEHRLVGTGQWTHEYPQREREAGGIILKSKFAPLVLSTQKEHCKTILPHIYHSTRRVTTT